MSKPDPNMVIPLFKNFQSIQAGLNISLQLSYPGLLDPRPFEVIDEIGMDDVILVLL